MSNHHSPLLAAEFRDLLRLLGYIYMQNGRADRAAVIYNALYAIDPSDIDATKSLACANIRCGKAVEALPLLDRLHDRGYSSALTHLLRSQALGSLGNTAEATRSMRLYVATRTEESKGKAV